MPFDGVAMRAAAAEIAGKLAGGRVEKVNQPERDEIHLLIRNNYKNYRLLVSASANHARVHLTQLGKHNPEKAPMFCMLLRKHLTGGKLLSAEQYDMERVLNLRFGVLDEMGQAGELTLHVEVMGRHSNAVLTQQDGTIIDSLKRVPEEKSRLREVLPGIPYAYPPPQGKHNPLETDARGLLEILSAAQEKPLWQAMCDGFTGLSQATARELLQGCGIDAALAASEFPADRLRAASEELFACFSDIRNNRFLPVIIQENGVTLDFFAYTKCTGGNRRAAGSISEAAESNFSGRDAKERLKQSSASMTQALGNALVRAKKKLEKQSVEMMSAGNLDGWRLKGELLTANLHLAAKGQDKVEVTNYYSEPADKLTIELNPAISPVDNAQRYFKKYAKAKSALDKLAVQMAATEQEIDYIEGQLHNIAQSAAQNELDEIKIELVEQGYLKQPVAKPRRQAAPSLPHHYLSGDGHDIYVGRNNAQNDYLTLKFARNDDVWMHTKQIPGSHVIIRAKGGAVSEAALRMGAMLAAHYSKARASSGVPVDYTQKRNVKKPAGARPGYVIYQTNRTIVTTPDETVIKSMTKATEGQERG